MLTVKLVRGNSIQIVEAETVNIYAAGKAVSVPEGEPAPLTNRVRGISCVLGGKIQDFFVGPAEDGNECWEYAYIENAQGRTTERVYAS